MTRLGPVHRNLKTLHILMNGLLPFMACKQPPEKIGGVERINWVKSQSDVSIDVPCCGSIEGLVYTREGQNVIQCANGVELWTTSVTDKYKGASPINCYFFCNHGGNIKIDKAR